MITMQHFDKINENTWMFTCFQINTPFLYEENIIIILENSNYFGMKHMYFHFRSSNDNKHMFYTRLSFITMCFSNANSSNNNKRILHAASFSTCLKNQVMITNLVSLTNVSQVHHKLIKQHWNFKTSMISLNLTLAMSTTTKR